MPRGEFPWFVEVALQRLPGEPIVHYLLGPCESWSRASQIARAWEQEHGIGTTFVHAHRPIAHGVMRRTTAPSGPKKRRLLLNPLGEPRR